jgi:hypothetical protein
LIQGRPETLTSEGKREEVIEMGRIKTVGTALLVVGIIILLVSLLADPIGIGDGTSFGGQQILGTVIGAIVTIVGGVLMRRQ